MKIKKDNLKYKIGNTILAFTIFIWFIVIIPLCQGSYIPIFIGANNFIYMKSIYSEHYKNFKTYSFWTKHIFNDHYVMAELNINCANRSYSVKSWIKFDNNGKQIGEYKNNFYLIDRNSIVPNTKGAKYYRIVCLPYVRYIYRLESAYPKLQGKFSLIENHKH